MKKLRLLLFKACNRNCYGCCNKDWDLDSLPIEEDFTGYKEIILTGGEPMLDPLFIVNTIQYIRKKLLAQTYYTPIYLYTANIIDIKEIFFVLNFIDGITVTLHEQKDVFPFKKFDRLLTDVVKIQNKSLRLNIFKEVNFTSFINPFWKVKKDIEWIKNCPLPKDEVFKKLQ